MLPAWPMDVRCNHQRQAIASAAGCATDLLVAPPTAARWRSDCRRHSFRHGLSHAWRPWKLSWVSRHPAYTLGTRQQAGLSTSHLRLVVRTANWYQRVSPVMKKQRKRPVLRASVKVVLPEPSPALVAALRCRLPAASGGIWQVIFIAGNTYGNGRVTSLMIFVRLQSLTTGRQRDCFCDPRGFICCCCFQLTLCKVPLWSTCSRSPMALTKGETLWRTLHNWGNGFLIGHAAYWSPAFILLVPMICLIFVAGRSVKGLMPVLQNTGGSGHAAYAIWLTVLIALIAVRRTGCLCVCWPGW